MQIRVSVNILYIYLYPGSIYIVSNRIIMNRIFTRLLAALLLSLLISGCARFRIEELKPNILVSLPVLMPDEENPDAFIQAEMAGRVLYNIPGIPALDGDMIYIPDPARKLLRVFSQSSGKLTALYGNSEKKYEDINYYPVDLGIPGLVSVDNDSGFYLQSHQVKTETEKENEQEDLTLTPAELRMPGRLNPASMHIQPSRILHVSDDGKLLSVIGKQGKNSDLFDNIVRLNSLDNRLFVLHNDREAGLTLSVFEDDELINTFRTDLSTLSGKPESYMTRTEDIVPAENNSVMASIIYRNKKNYDIVSRLILRINENGTQEEVLRINDPSDYFSWTHEKGGFYITRVEDDGSGILFKIYSPTGEYINNRLIRFPGVRSSWLETFITMNDRILSTRINRGRYEIYEWK